ncbi:MAG: hypothetical protein K6E58_00640 [Eubacterium sp.]|nr:hypothetical protein [Eubacterium sp.]
MKKELYFSPEVEWEEFDLKDVITTSGQGVVANDDDPDSPEGPASWSDPVG